MRDPVFFVELPAESKAAACAPKQQKLPGSPAWHAAGEAPPGRRGWWSGSDEPQRRMFFSRAPSPVPISSLFGRS